MKAYNSIIKPYVKRRVIYFYLKLFLKLFLKLCKKGKRRCLDESKRTRQKKAEIKGRGGEEGRKTKRKSKTRKGKNRAAN